VSEETQGIISAEESRSFRRARSILAWLILASVPVLALMRVAPWLFGIYAFAWFVVCAYAVFWPCPRCHRPYALRFGVISIAWPWVNQCLHCESKLSSQ